MNIALGLLLIAVIFLIWKLNDILGTQQGHVPRFGGEPGKKSGSAASGKAPPQLDVDDADDAVVEPAHRAVTPDMIADSSDAQAVSAGLSEVAAQDANFDAHSFLDGAKSAFDMIMAAFATGDRDTLSSLVSKEIFSAFDGAIVARQNQGHSLNFTIIEEPKVSYYTAEIDRGVAYIGVQIDSLQTSVTRDADDQIVGGDEDLRPTKVSNQWVFSRQVNADDPNWTLIQTAA